MVKFLQPGWYIRIFDRKEKGFKYYRLLEREAPMKYPYVFSELAPGSVSDIKILKDLNPARGRVYQFFIGVRNGIQVRVWHPYDEKMLKLDVAVPKDIAESETANLEYRDSPYENPKFSILIVRNRYPGLVVKNLINYTIHPQVIFIGAKFNYEEVTDPNILDKLKKHIIKSTPMVVGKVE